MAEDSKPLLPKSLQPEFLRARARQQRLQAAKARRLASTIPNDEMAGRLSELAGQLEHEAARDERAARQVPDHQDDR